MENDKEKNHHRFLVRNHMHYNITNVLKEKKNTLNFMLLIIYLKTKANEAFLHTYTHTLRKSVICGPIHEKLLKEILQVESL